MIRKQIHGLFVSKSGYLESFSKIVTHIIPKIRIIKNISSSTFHAKTPEFCDSGTLRRVKPWGIGSICPADSKQGAYFHVNCYLKVTCNILLLGQRGSTMVS